MKYKLTALIAIVALFSLNAYAGWNFVKVFPDTSFKTADGLGAHGIAVSPDGRVWLQKYGTSDSILQANGTYGKVRQVYCFNPDGTPAPWNGAKTTTVGGVTDTLWNSGRGMKADYDGNIWYTWFDTYYKLDYKTGQGLAKLAGPITVGTTTQTLTAPAFTSVGELFAAGVIPPLPIKIYDASQNFLGNAIDTSVGYSRTFEVSADGNDVYWMGYTNYAIYKYHSDFGTLGPYVFSDTIGKGCSSEAACWNPKDHNLWMGGGSAITPGYGQFRAFGYYAYNPTTKTFVDSLFWNMNLYPASTDPRPRGIAFSPGGDTCYVVAFNTSDPCVQMFVRGATDVRPEPNVIPTGFTLSQNYPNPFNPKTEIKFTIDHAGLTTLIVYDLLGREVATLVNENMAVGAYTASFDASALSSGTYVYKLTSGINTITKKMMLVK